MSSKLSLGRSMVVAVVLAGTGGTGVAAQVAPPSYPMARHGGGYMQAYYVPPNPSAQPWAPSWSPDGRWLAVSMAGSIWRLNIATGAAEELVVDPEAYLSSPDWSPDGRYIIYTADLDSDGIQLGIADLEAGSTRRLTDDEFVYADPVYSPDGSAVAYVTTRPSGYFNVYVRPISGSAWAGPEVPVTSDHTFPSNRLYFGDQDMHTQPAWLPNGRELLLVSNRDVPLGSGNVLRVPAEADGISRATTVLREQTLYRTRPDVSVDGKRFVYSSTVGAADQFNNLYVQPTVGGEPYKLTFFEHDAFHPRWSPDGSWIAYVTNRDGVPGIGLLETYGGRQRHLEIVERTWSRPVGTLRVRVVSDESDGPLPARVILEAGDGKFYAPPDAYARIGHAGDHLFHADGFFELEMPAGSGSLTVMHGFETWPETERFTVQAGDTTDLVVRLRRMADLGAEGCYSGSTHVHMNYAGNLHNTLDNLSFMSRAEDQDILNEQIANKDNRVLDHQFFEPGGGAHSSSTEDQVVVVGQEYRPPFYGHVFMLGLREHLISPFVTGYEGTAIESLYPSNTDMLSKAIDQGATVGYVHPFVSDADPLEGNLGGAKGFMVDAALGTTHALEWSLPGRAGFFPLYAVWNNGLRITAVGGEDSITDLYRWRIMGSLRTYVCTESGRLTPQEWYSGLRQGRAFVTSGPLVNLTANGAGPGSTIDLPAGGTVTVEGSIRSITPVRTAELVQDGEVIWSFDLQGERKQLDIRAEIPVDESGWVHLRAWGDPDDRFPLDLGQALAFTNPIWVTVAGAPPRDEAAARYGVRWIDRLRELAEAWPGWRSEDEKVHVFGQFDRAKAVYQRLAREAAGRSSDER